MKLIRYEYPPTPRSLLGSPFENLFERAMADFNSLWPAGDIFAGPATNLPSADLYEDAENFYVRFELPGVKRDHLNLELENYVLTLHVRREEKGQDGESSHSLTRSISVPDGVDADRVKAGYEDGILTVTLPKAEQRKPKAIEVK